MNLKRYFDKFWASLSTLSIIPCPKLDNEAYSDMGKLLMFSPAVGAVISLICTSAAAGAAFAVSKHSHQNFMPLLPAAFYIVSKALLTRGFHLDGLADTFDGFGGGWTKERILEIMRDSAIGSFGAIALISVLLIQFSACVSLCTPNTHNISAVSALFLVPIFSRTIMVWQAAENRYARDSASLAGNVVSQTDRKHFFGSAYIALLSSAPVLAFNFFKSGTDFIALSLISLSLGFMSAAVLRAVSIKKIGGITGDILGATTEISEAVMLSFFAISV